MPCTKAKTTMEAPEKNGGAEARRIDDDEVRLRWKWLQVKQHRASVVVASCFVIVLVLIVLLPLLLVPSLRAGPGQVWHSWDELSSQILLCCLSCLQTVSTIVSLTTSCILRQWRTLSVFALPS